MFGCDPKSYDLKVELAKCCNNIGTVFLARHIPNGEYVAVKKYRIDFAREESNLIRDEILIMRQFNHPNILSFYTAFVYDFEVYVISPLMCFGSCKDTIANCFQTGIPEIIISLILRDILLGLEYLHQKGFIHRAIRASHILLNKTRALITGFRECTNIVSHGERTKILHNLAPYSKKSLNWLAPEVLEQNLLGYTEKSDVYSVGITACELANGVEPFADMKSTFMLTEKIRGSPITLLDNSTCPTEELIAQQCGTGIDSIAVKTRQIYGQRQFSEPFHKFTELCTERFPNDRPPITQLLNHSFFKQCKNTCLYEQLKTFGVEVADYENLRDETIGLSCEINEMCLNDNFDWDF
ncbi:putative serine/threonine-protein kinase STE20-like [Condylostylus longicornis]|uniref:putative serine/threonine-protein kinase STE20-like n=1 Tax=Condylostylus longicornis TaxID=2530218 RepID=UPI00244E1693|nr:putative serine/threonine-protein kinase STE20-like [Condylostylus longicornis]XP_055374146.1 putative serine/threonine-protein kinase STE20-like [Condylostylus longicornis]